MVSERMREVLLGARAWSRAIWSHGRRASRSSASGLWIFNRISPHFEDFL
jgi:hypothetical protein